MNTLQNKIDFSLILSVKNANPNGDPLNGNRPRENYAGFGEISDVCIKRKIRNRLQDMGNIIFVQSDDNKKDNCDNLFSRAESVAALKEILNSKTKDKYSFADIACKQWSDVRSFGQVFAFKGNDLSVGVRGPVSVHPAFSISPVNIESIQITKSVNSTAKDKKSNTGEDENITGKSSDTMGMKHRIEFGVYRLNGSINCQLAEKTGFNEEDAENIKQALITLFENDASAARPDGSMEVYKLYWWKHNCKSGQYSSAKVHRSLKINVKNENARTIDEYAELILESLPDLTAVEYDGR